MKANEAGIYVPNTATPPGQALFTLYGCEQRVGVSAAFVVEVVEHVDGGTLIFTTTSPEPRHVAQTFDEVNESLAKAVE